MRAEGSPLPEKDKVVVDLLSRSLPDGVSNATEGQCMQRGSSLFSSHSAISCWLYLSKKPQQTWKIDIHQIVELAAVFDFFSPASPMILLSNHELNVQPHPISFQYANILFHFLVTSPESKERSLMFPLCILFPFTDFSSIFSLCT